jgi:hypothetical protein
MNQQEIQQKIDQINAQRDQLLMQIGGCNAALAVYQEWLKSASAPPAGTPDTTPAALPPQPA